MSTEKMQDAGRNNERPARRFERKKARQSKRLTKRRASTFFCAATAILHTTPRPWPRQGLQSIDVPLCISTIEARLCCGIPSKGTGFLETRRSPPFPQATNGPRVRSRGASVLP